MSKEETSTSTSTFSKDVFLGKPISNRSETEAVISALHENKATTNDHVFGQGPFILSDIPKSALSKDGDSRGVILGIDEAGRGSVLGPMIYGCAYWQRPKESENEDTMFADSKKLTEERRSFLWKNKILADSNIGFALRVLTASEISHNMNQVTPYNLNQMSHDSTIQIIQRLLDEGVNLEHCYIDTVGNPVHYQRRLEQVFSRYSISFTVEPKADDNYAPCQAASIVAKVTRDSIVQQLSPLFDKSLGSGYPSDPTCQAWIRHELENNSCPVFGFSAKAAPLVRFSWNPIKLAFEKKTGGTRTLSFAADDQDDENPEHAQQAKRQRTSMQAFLGQNKKRRYPYMERKGIKAVSEL
mmetsp:Transcript_12281/g.16079  ORF Transcript_12281/g.16079 Transcript_12281/m.16079 type:complete len:356 (-) Transcript_12281:149-1216(-)|eukprot:CAMPEP_0198145882 /NCGR_PEP_ID=MMETSP1443-20131203/25903_1 /TAXON_ID=186043 /ORGANISM="Entomoneis sp., Strain CCMP2396" /LENGTH=355 /DNA_ID=CAMNT_0043809643 /DNA_START=53 /DNA_END=1120 /DNA_ORIENTATION=-